MKYLSLFSGIGGFELGIQQAYELQKLCVEDEEQGLQRVGSEKGRQSKCNNLSTDGLTCIGYSEIDKYAIQIYQSHFNHKNYGDITKINAEELPDFDFLCGGFPCQSFSIAGKRGGFADTRGTLFFDIARILKVKQPRLFLLENVKGLLSHDNGNTFKTIISTLDELGYDLQWQVLNSKNFGVPQNRERVFIVGHLRGTSRPEVFPITGSGEKYTRETDQQGCTSTLTGRNAGGQNRRENYIVKAFQSDKQSSQQEGNKSNSTDSIWRKAHSNDFRIRRLTPVECMRLQGFPDNWCDGVSDTQKYKCAGNAVTVNVIQAIMEKII